MDEPVTIGSVAIGQRFTEPTRLRAVASVELPAQMLSSVVVKFEHEGQVVIVPTTEGSFSAVMRALPGVGLWGVGFGPRDAEGRFTLHAWKVEPAGGEGDLPREGWLLVERPEWVKDDDLAVALPYRFASARFPNDLG